MKPKQILLELAILIAIYLLSFFCWPPLFKWFYSFLTLDINLHDTYFSIKVSPFESLVLYTFSLLNTFIYFIRAVIKRYKNNLVNVITVASNFLSIIVLINIYHTVINSEQMMSGTEKGFTIYPPLSGWDNPPFSPGEHPHFDIYMFIPITIFMLMLVISSIFTGKNWKTNTHEQASA